MLTSLEKRVSRLRSRRVLLLVLTAVLALIPISRQNGGAGDHECSGGPDQLPQTFVDCCLERPALAPRDDE